MTVSLAEAVCSRTIGHFQCCIGPGGSLPGGSGDSGSSSRIGAGGTQPYGGAANGGNGRVVISFTPAVSGTLSLGNFIGDPTTIPVSVSIVDPNSGNTIQSSTQLLGSGATIAIPTSTTSGTYDVLVKGAHWLQKRIKGVTFAAGGALVGTVNQLNGDIDGDNLVTIIDYSIFSDYYDRYYYDGGWTTVGSDGFAPKDADLDGDGFVTILDYSYLSTNFDLAGDS